MWGIFRIFALSIRNLGTMKITLIIKKSVKRYDTESKATIYARLRDGRQVDMVAPTRLTINPNLWDDKAEQVKSKIVCDDEMRSYSTMKPANSSPTSKKPINPDRRQNRRKSG